MKRSLSITYLVRVRLLLETLVDFGSLDTLFFEVLDGCRRDLLDADLVGLRGTTRRSHVSSNLIV